MRDNEAANSKETGLTPFSGPFWWQSSRNKIIQSGGSFGQPWYILIIFKYYKQRVKFAKHLKSLLASKECVDD